LIRQIISEIKSHQTLLTASEENLDVKSLSFNAIQVGKDLVEVYSNSVLSEGKVLVFNSSSENIILSSDIALLSRTVENMIVNALEATAEGGQVTISCNETADNGVKFSVHNQGLIPAEVQAQLFKRTFSTKGKGRGYGTYGMRLLSSLIKGKVWLTSTEADGTTFFAEFHSF